jgi:hypothetical protein
MSATRSAESTASRAANSKALEVLTRAGFIGYGIVHLLFAWIVLQLAFNRSNAEGDQSGAMTKLAAQPLGKVLIIAVAVGLTAMAIWQVFEAAIGHTSDRGRERVMERVASAFRAVVYAYFAYTAWKIFNDVSTSSADSQQKTTEGLLGSSGGRWLVGLAGLVVAAIGVGLVVYGIKKKFEKHLNTGQMSPSTRRLTQRMGVAGYSAKGVAYTIAGVLFVVAAVNYDPEKARGLDAALDALRRQTYGSILLALMALGIAAFGVFCFFQSRYRKV